jgi:predicted permease
MTIASIAGALVPIAALLGLGVLLRRVRGFSDPAFWSGAERLAYFVLLPVLLFVNIATVDLAGVPLARMAAAVVVPTLLVTVLLFALHRVVAPSAPAFTSVLQGSVRFNTYVGVSLAISISPGEGAALAGVVGAVLVPLVNIIATLGFEVFLVDKGSLLALVRKIVLNPLVLACVLGAGAGMLPVEAPEVVLAVLDPLAAAALPVGLLCVGAGLRRIELRTHAVGLRREAHHPARAHARGPRRPGRERARRAHRARVLLDRHGEHVVRAGASAGRGRVPHGGAHRVPDRRVVRDAAARADRGRRGAAVTCGERSWMCA